MIFARLTDKNRSIIFFSFAGENSFPRSTRSTLSFFHSGYAQNRRISTLYPRPHLFSRPVFTHPLSVCMVVLWRSSKPKCKATTLKVLRKMLDEYLWCRRRRGLEFYISNKIFILLRKPKLFMSFLKPKLCFVL